MLSETKTEKAFKPISDDDAKKLIVAMAHARAGGAFTEDEAAALVLWAENAVVDFGLLQLVLKGKLGIDFRDGEPLFCDPHRDETRGDDAASTPRRERA